MYSITETVTPSRTGEDGNLKLVAATQMMQDCSEMWFDSEPGLRKYFQENNISQLLASRQIDIIRIPQLGEKLTITTSVFECKGVQGFRNTIIRDEQGKTCYITWSTGAFVCHDTGRMSKIPIEVTNQMVYDPKYEMEYLERKIILPKNEYTEYPPVQVKKDDIDYNRHMNNAQYVRVAYEFIPDNFDVKRIRLEYKIPAKQGDWLYPTTFLHTEKGKFFVVLTNETGQNHVVVEFS